MLGAGTALALGAVDVTYAARGRIPRVFLLDAMVEFLFAAAWCGVAMRGSTRDPAAGPLRGAIE